MQETYTPPRYPTVRFLATHGMKLAWLLALCGALTGILLTVELGGWFWSVAGVAAGALLGVLMASYTEVLRIVADTLIPH